VDGIVQGGREPMRAGSNSMSWGWTAISSPAEAAAVADTHGDGPSPEALHGVEERGALLSSLLAVSMLITAVSAALLIVQWVSPEEQLMPSHWAF
jgi:hypothetical protein